MDNNNLNPADLHTREDFGDEIPKSISRSPDSPDIDSAEQAREAEQSPGFSYTGDKDDKNSSPDSDANKPDSAKSKGKVKTFLKKAGPITTLVLLLFTAGGIFLGTMTPAMVTNNFMTIMGRSLNSGKTSAESRKIANLLAKVNSTNVLNKLAKKGKFFGRRSNRFANMSQRTIANLEKNGWKVNVKKDLPFGRHKIESLEFDGQTFSGTKDLGKALANDPSMTKSLQRGLRGRFAETADRVAKSALNRGKLFIKRLFGLKPKADVDDVADDIADSVDDALPPKTNQVDGAKDRITKAEDELNQSETDAHQKASAKSQLEDAAETVKEAEATKAKRLPLKNNPALKTAGKLLGKINSAISIGSTVCGVFNPLYSAISFLKTDNAATMGRYARIVFQGASAIRAGDATEEETSFLGDLLFGVRSVNSGFGGGSSGGGGASGSWGGAGAVEKSAASSIAFSLAAHQQVPDLSDRDDPSVASAVQFQNGTPAEVADIYGAIGGSTGNLAKLCGFLNSPTGQTINLIANVAGVIITIMTGGGTLAAGAISRAAWEATKGIAGSIATGWISRAMVSSLTGFPVSSLTRGEDAGNAIGAGGEVLFGGITSGTSGGVLTKPAAVNLYKAHQVLIAREAEANRATLSPFDTSTPDTFMGSIVSGLLPYYGQIQTFRGQVRAVASLAAKSIHRLLPSTKALADSDTNINAMFSQCHDFDYNQGAFKDVAFSIFCNPVYGIPIESLYTQEVAVAMGLPLTQSTMVAKANKTKLPVESGEWELEDSEELTQPIKYAGDLFTPDKVIAYLAEAKYIDEDDDGSYAEPKGALLDYRDQCITRGMVPLADSNLDDPDLGDHFYGKNVGYGENCILESISDITLPTKDEPLKDESGKPITTTITTKNKDDKTVAVTTQVIDHSELSNVLTEEEKERGETITERQKVDRIMFALFYTDERIQCMIDQDEDCQIDPTVADPGLSHNSGPILSDGTWPISSTTSRAITSTFGCRNPVPGTPLTTRNFHNGIDFPVAVGNDVVAVQDGTIIKAAWSDKSGNVIRLAGSDGNIYRYAHLDSMAVSANDQVKKGQLIGKTGKTGDYCNGPHLHFDVHNNTTKLYSHPLRFLGDEGARILETDKSEIKFMSLTEAEGKALCPPLTTTPRRGTLTPI